MRIRYGREEDLPRLLEIYNYYVEHSPITFDIAQQTLDSRRAWFEDFTETGPHRLFVAEDADGVSGYASSRVFRTRAAYDRTVESSIYLAHDRAGKGIGSVLYGHLIDFLVSDPSVHRVYGGVTLPNEASCALHQKAGFKRVGTFAEVGFKFGRYWDVAWFERAV